MLLDLEKYKQATKVLNEIKSSVDKSEKTALLKSIEYVKYANQNSSCNFLIPELLSIYLV